MSLLQPSDAAPDVSTLRWTGYGLAAAGVVAGFMRLVQPGPLWTAITLVTAVATLAIMLRAPEAFETRWRSGNSGPNLLIGAPAAFLFFAALRDQIDDLTLPMAAAAADAAVLLIASTRVAYRPGVTRPVTFQVVAAVLGAALGFGAVVALDVDYDRSTPAVLPVQVLDKYETHSRSSTTYHLRLPPFGTRKGSSSMVVTYADYRALKLGDPACVLEHRGAIGVPWITAGPCNL
jgi:hypothetical protein